MQKVGLRYLHNFITEPLSIKLTQMTKPTSPFPRPGARFKYHHGLRVWQVAVPSSSHLFAGVVALRVDVGDGYLFAISFPIGSDPSSGIDGSKKIDSFVL